MTTNVTKQIAKRDHEERSKWKNLTSAAAGKSEHEEDIPEVAPLVFPALDNMSDEKKENAMKQFSHFMNDYSDRRSQAKFDGAHPVSKLAGVTPRKEFASVYADPNHPAGRGGIIAVVSAGKYNPQGFLGLGGLRNRKKSDSRARTSILHGSHDGRAQADSIRERRKQRKSRRGLRSLLKQDALYLLFVNMPTKEEMDAVLAQVGEMD